MSTNYRVTSPKQFFNKAEERENQNSLFDHLGTVLKNSLTIVWNYVKTIDVKSSIQQGMEGNGIGVKQSKLGIAKNIKQQANNIPIEQNSKPNQHSLDNQSRNKDTLSKRQMLKQKKQRKKISFQQYEQQQQKKINQSFIRKNIEIKKALNKSIQSLRQQHQQKQNILQQLEKNIDHNNPQQQQQEILIPKDTNTQQKFTNYHNKKNQNQNESLILNISDIDSQCNFNILNSSQLNQSSSLLKDQHLRGQFLRENFQDQYDDVNGVNQGQMQINVPKLELKEYPFLGHAPRISYRAKNNERYHQRKNSINYKVNYNKNNYKSKQKISTTNQQQIDHFENECIDVDALYYPPLQHNPKKRIAAPFIKYNQTQIRKKVKYNQQQIILQGEKITPKMLEKQQKFDRLVASRYEKIIETLNGQKEEDRQQRLTLKQEYEKFLEKNFAPANYIKQKLQKQSLKLDQKQKLPAQKLKFSQYLKQVDMTPQIQRKKLYNFTKQCQSKISISEQLRKSILQDKEKQYMQEMRRKKEQEMRRRRQEEQLRRREQQEQMRSRQQQERRQKQQEQLRLAEQMKKQESQIQESQKQTQLDISNKPVQTNQQQQNAQKPETVAEKPLIKQTIASPKSEQAKQRTQKQSVKPFSLFDAPKTSLFSLAQKRPSQQKIPQQSAGNKQDQLIKKPSVVQGKSTEEVKVKQTPQVVKPTELASKPSETQAPKKSQGTKHNPFLAPVKTPNVTLLQQLINSKKDDASVFKSTISSTPFTSNSPQRQPPTVNPSSFQSPVHNTSQYSNLDSSMCEQSESNITPGVLPTNNLNGSFLNASFSSHTGSVFPGNSASFLNGPTTTGGASGLFNTGSFNPAGQTSGLFGNAPSQAPSGGLFGNQPQQTGGFMSAAQSAKFEAINKVPSFMQNQPSLIPTISPQTAVSLFSQRSPSKGEPQSSLFGPSPSQAPKPSSSRRNQRKQERIR